MLDPGVPAHFSKITFTKGFSWSVTYSDTERRYLKETST